MSDATSPPTSAARAGGARALLLAALGYALLTVLYTWPAATGLRGQMFGGGWDGPMFLWNLWWGPHALFELHQDPLTTTHLFHPDGVSLVVNTHSLLPALISWPLQKLLGLVPTYNVMILLTFVLSGIGAYLLTDEVVRDRRVAFVAGAIFAFGHLRTSKVIFFNLIQTDLLVFWAWALWRALERRSWKWSAVAGAIGAAIFWTDYNLVVFAALWGAAFALFALFECRRFGLSRVGLLARFGVMAVVLGALSSPLARRLVPEFDAAGSYENVEETDSYAEATPLSRFLVWGELGGRQEGGGTPIRQAAFLGYATLALAAVGLWARRKEPIAKYLLGVALLFLLLALGPELNLGSTIRPSPKQSFHLPLPYRWLHSVPILKEIRVAHRFGIVAWIALSLAAGLGLRALLRRLEARGTSSGRKLAHAAAGLACAAVMADFTRLPFPRLSDLPPIGAGLRAIADDARDSVVAEYPGGRLGDPLFAWYETVHGKPVYLDGQVSRLPDELRDARTDSKLHRLLRRLFLDETFKGGDPDGSRLKALGTTARAEMREQKIGWIVLSQTDRDLLVQRRGAWTVEELHRVDERMRQALPDAARVWFLSDEEIRRFIKPAEVPRWSQGALFAVYRFEFP